MSSSNLIDKVDFSSSKKKPNYEDNINSLLFILFLSGVVSFLYIFLSNLSILGSYSFWFSWPGLSLLCLLLIYGYAYYSANSLDNKIKQEDEKEYNEKGSLSMRLAEVFMLNQMLQNSSYDEINNLSSRMKNILISSLKMELKAKESYIKKIAELNSTINYNFELVKYKDLNEKQVVEHKNNIHNLENELRSNKETLGILQKYFKLVLAEGADNNSLIFKLERDRERLQCELNSLKEKIKPETSAFKAESESEVFSGMDGVLRINSEDQSIPSFTLKNDTPSIKDVPVNSKSFGSRLQSACKKMYKRLF